MRETGACYGAGTFTPALFQQDSPSSSSSSSFAVPPDWTEEQERTLVAEVGALLPAGICLEYEGRYQAMLSHAIKNYALLTYSGQGGTAPDSA